LVVRAVDSDAMRAFDGVDEVNCALSLQELVVSISAFVFVGINVEVRCAVLNQSPRPVVFSRYPATLGLASD
jgi:hypothetical protein